MRARVRRDAAARYLRFARGLARHGAVPPSPVTDLRGRPGLLAEEVDPRVDEEGGNVPLVWSHAEAARAMYVLDAATLRARFGLPLYGHGDR